MRHIRRISQTIANELNYIKNITLMRPEGDKRAMRVFKNDKTFLTPILLVFCFFNMFPDIRCR
jgi:hypothetical protein